MSNSLLKALEDGQIDAATYVRGCVKRRLRPGFDSLLTGVRQAVAGYHYQENCSRSDIFGRSGEVTSTTISLQWLPVLPNGELWDGPRLELSTKGLGIRSSEFAWCGFLPLRRIDQSGLVVAMIRGSELYVRLDPLWSGASTNRTTWKAEEAGWKKLRPRLLAYATHEDLLIGVRTALDLYLADPHHREPTVTFDGCCLTWKLGEVKIKLYRMGLEGWVNDQLLFQLPPYMSEVAGRRQVGVARVAVLGALQQVLPMMMTT